MDRQQFAFAGAKSKPLEKFLGCSSLCAGINQRMHHYGSVLRGRGANAVADVTAQISSTINSAAAATAHIFLGGSNAESLTVSFDAIGTESFLHLGPSHKAPLSVRVESASGRKKLVIGPADADVKQRMRDLTYSMKLISKQQQLLHSWTEKIGRGDAHEIDPSSVSAGRDPTTQVLHDVEQVRDNLCISLIRRSCAAAVHPRTATWSFRSCRRRWRCTTCSCRRRPRRTTSAACPWAKTSARCAPHLTSSSPYVMCV
jgi:hypothetical protein